MACPHSKSTIVAFAVLAAAAGSLLHEGVGHGLIAWLRGDIVTQLTSNHLDTVKPDRLVDAGGTIVNVIAGLLSLLGAHCAGERANLRYFLWLLAAFNLLDAAGYFLFSGILGLGDWASFIAGMPQQGLLRTFMAIMGAALYIAFVRLLGITVKPFVPNRGTYNVVGRLPYLAACLFMCVVAAFDPLGLKLLFLSTVPAYFGGHSGLLWVDALMPRNTPERVLVVQRSAAVWIAAAVLGTAFLVLIGRGIRFAQ